MNTIKENLTVLYVTWISGNQKAIVGFVVPMVLGSIAFTGVTGDMTVRDALSLLLTAALTGASVWLKRNK